ISAATMDIQRMGRLDIFMNTFWQNHLEWPTHRIMMPGKPRGGLVGCAERSRGNAMPVANVRGVNIFYQVIGDRGPWAALITGGRRGHDEFVPLATKLANAGYRVVLPARRNT